MQVLSRTEGMFRQCLLTRIITSGCVCIRILSIGPGTFLMWLLALEYEWNITNLATDPKIHISKSEACKLPGGNVVLMLWLRKAPRPSPFVFLDSVPISEGLPMCCHWEDWVTPLSLWDTAHWRAHTWRKSCYSHVAAWQPSSMAMGNPSRLAVLWDWG